MLPDLLEYVQGLWVFQFDIVWRLTVVWPEVHVAVGVEIVDEFNVGFVFDDESADSSCFWLGKWFRTSVVFGTWIRTATSGFVPCNSIISIKVDSNRFFRTQSSIVEVHVLPLFREHSSCDELVFNICESIDIYNRDDIILILNEHVYVMLLSMDNAPVKKLED